jgi:hypothetical protein
MRLPTGAGRFGYRLAAGDFDRDGAGDLVVGSPGLRSGPDSGVVQVLFGSRDGLRAARRRTIRRPTDTAYAAFGSRMRAGDINDDGNLDLVVGSPDRPADGATGHLAYCPGTRTGPKGCRRLSGGGTSSLAIADVTGDGFDDIVQGDADPVPLLLADSGGEIRLWRGGPDGPADAPLVIDQSMTNSGAVDEPGDQFGSTLDAGDLDHDRYADMFVGAPGEDDHRGAVSVIRGGSSGFAQFGNTAFGKAQPGVPGKAAPGDRFGWSVAILRASGDDRPDVAVVVGGAKRLADAVLIIEAGDGVLFAPEETRATRLFRQNDYVAQPRIDRIRLGRPRDS